MYTTSSIMAKTYTFYKPVVKKRIQLREVFSTVFFCYCKNKIWFSHKILKILIELLFCTTWAKRKNVRAGYKQNLKLLAAVKSVYATVFSAFSLLLNLHQFILILFLNSFIA